MAVGIGQRGRGVGKRGHDLDNTHALTGCATADFRSRLMGKSKLKRPDVPEKGMISK